MKKPYLIFDFDGTIADTFHYILDLSNRLADEFKYKKIPYNEIEKMKDKSFMETVEHLDVSYAKIPFILARAKRELHADIHDMDPIKGLVPILRTLHAKKIKMGILSSNSQKNIKKFLKTHDLDIFEFIKTSPKILGKHHVFNRLVKKYNLPKKSIVYFGDETRDVESAKKANICVAAVTWGYNSKAALKALKPDHLLSKPKDILKLLGIK